MPTIVAPSTLTVTIAEQIELHSRSFNTRNRITFPGISEISSRIVSTDGTGSTEIVRFAASASAGQFVNSDVRYVRITNLDDTKFATLRFTGASSTDYAFRLDPEGSHIIQATLPSGSANVGVTKYADISGVTLTDLQAIAATANSASVDLELFVASV